MKYELNVIMKETDDKERTRQQNTHRKQHDNTTKHTQKTTQKTTQPRNLKTSTRMHTEFRVRLCRGWNGP